MSRRSTLRAAVALCAAAALFLLYLLFESQWLRRVDHEIEIPDLPPDLEGFTVVQLSDIHAGSRPSFNLRVLGKAVAVTRTVDPDLVVITGDLVTGGSRLDALANDLRRLPARHGVFAVLGNHDHGLIKLVRAEPVDLSWLDDETGVRLLTDECVSIVVGDATVQVCGVDDVRHGFGDGASVLAALDRTPGVLRLLLSHYGEVAANTARGDFALIMVGDTHGGQICLPGPGPDGRLMLGQPRAHFGAGFHDDEGGPVYVSRGVGTSFLPFRLLARPEVTVFRFRRGAS